MWNEKQLWEAQMLGVIPFVLVKSLRLKTKKNVLKNKKIPIY
jgi:hypothetical protein